MRATDRKNYQNRHFRKRVNRMHELARAIGYSVRLDWYTVSSEWIRCELRNDWSPGEIIKRCSFWEMEHYLEVCNKLKAFL